MPSQVEVVRTKPNARIGIAWAGSDSHIELPDHIPLEILREVNLDGDLVPNLTDAGSDQPPDLLDIRSAGPGDALRERDRRAGHRAGITGKRGRDDVDLPTQGPNMSAA